MSALHVGLRLMMCKNDSATLCDSKSIHRASDFLSLRPKFRQHVFLQLSVSDLLVNSVNSECAWLMSALHVVLRLMMCKNDSATLCDSKSIHRASDFLSWRANFRQHVFLQLAAFFV
jgi:hypothetical protein